MDFFSRWIREVTGGAELPPAREASIQLFDVELPSAMNALIEDQSPAAMARASVTYNMIIEGVLAETGYANYHRSLAVNDLMPGLCAGLVNIKRDESRHIAYGVYLLSRLVAEDHTVWQVIEERMTELQPLTEAIVASAYEDNPDGDHPVRPARGRVHRVRGQSVLQALQPHLQSSRADPGRHRSVERARRRRGPGHGGLSGAAPPQLRGDEPLELPAGKPRDPLEPRSPGSSWLRASSCSSVICPAIAGWFASMWPRALTSSSLTSSPRTTVPHSQTMTFRIGGSVARHVRTRCRAGCSFAARWSCGSPGST